MSIFRRISQFVSKHSLKIGALGVGSILTVAALLGTPVFLFTGAVIALGAGVTALVRKYKGVENPLDPGPLLVGGTLAVLALTMASTGITSVGITAAGAIPLQASAEAERELDEARCDAPAHAPGTHVPGTLPAKAPAPLPLSSSLKAKTEEPSEARRVLGGEEATPTPPTLRYGESGDPAWIRRAQNALVALGFNPGSAQRGSFDSDTWRMVREFQRRAGLPVNGTLDSATWSALQDQLRQKGETPSEASYADAGGLNSALRSASRVR